MFGRRPPQTPSQIEKMKKRNLTTNQQLSLENTHNLIKLRGASQGKTGIDINIHGTFARGDDWVKNSSEFTNESKRAGTAATNFQWTGGGAEKKRVEAGQQLSAFMKDVNRPTINRTGGNEINAIAHSHGGNVLGKAMSTPGTPSISNAVMMGTPQMTKNGQHVSWSPQGADNVRNNIINVYDKKDNVQKQIAKVYDTVVMGNSHSIGRKFDQPQSSTPQHNVRIDSGRMFSSTAAHSNIKDSFGGKLVNKMLTASNSPQGQAASAAQRQKNQTAINAGLWAHAPKKHTVRKPK